MISVKQFVTSFKMAVDVRVLGGYPDGTGGGSPVVWRVRGGAGDQPARMTAVGAAVVSGLEGRPKGGRRGDA